MGSEEFETEVLAILKRIERYLFWLAEERMVEQQKRLEARYLTTAPRRRMWQLMDGRHSLAQIADEVKVSGEAVRQFVNELLESPQPLIEVVSQGRNRLPRRLL